MQRLTYVLFLFLLSIGCVDQILAADTLHAKKINKQTLAIASIFQNEGPYLKEWIEYHKIVGVKKFYLYNHLSTDNYLEELAPYIKNKEVELVDWTYSYDEGNHGQWIKIQINAYINALAKAKKGKITWLAMIDADEYIVPVQKNTILEFLNDRCKDAAGVCGRWVFFGTSNVPSIPANITMIESLIRNEGHSAEKKAQLVWESGAYKSIGRVASIKNIPSPHYFNYEGSSKHYLEELNHLQINHYWTRDEYYFYNKKTPSRIERGHPAPQMGRKNAAFEPYGLPILRFVPQLRKKLGLANLDSD